MKQVLITGGTGFLGRRAVAFFKDLGFPVLSPSHGELDITDEASVRNWFISIRYKAQQLYSTKTAIL